MTALWLLVLALGGLLSWAVVTDLQRRRIRDQANAATALLGLCFAMISGGWWALSLGAATGIIGGAILLAMRRVLGPGAVGLGDVKLTAALGPWLGPFGLVLALLLACLGLLASALLRRSAQPAPLAPYLAPPVLVIAALAVAARGAA